MYVDTNIVKEHAVFKIDCDVRIQKTKIWIRNIMET